MNIYNSIIQWLYLNDGKYNSKAEWREAFLSFLREVLGEPDCVVDNSAIEGGPGTGTTIIKHGG